MEEKQTDANQQMTFYFGREPSMKVNADSLEEAIGEFILSCIDFSEYSHKHNDILGFRKEPFGYMDGVRNDDYNKHRYYETISVWCDNPYFRKTTDNKSNLVYTLTLTEFRTFHHKQKNILTYDVSNKEESESKEVRASSMVQMKNHIIQASAKIRDMKLQMALSRKHDLISVKSESEKLSSELKRIEGEHAHLNKKMGILKTYTGIGRDIIKVRGGEPSDNKLIDIFQSFRYMKEDVELLTDFEGFDARNLEQFDDFIKEHYKELLPSSKCIQAFKVTKHKIMYGDFFLQEAMDKENSKVFILARNGDNVYRLFNNYKLHDKNLFMLDNPEDEMNYLIEQEREWGWGRE